MKKRLAASTARTLLAIVFIFSGAVKAIDPLGTVYKIEDYLKAFGSSAEFFNLLLPLAGLAAVLLIMTELVLGITMLLNVRTRWTSWITLAFYCVMTPLTLYIALTNPVSDCGCFGDALVLTNWQTFWKNVVLISLAILLVAFRNDVPTLVSWKTELAITAVAIVLSLGAMAYSYSHLPCIDFRPYKVGNNIPELMEYPEDAEQDEYEIAFIYSKDGVEKRFTLEDYPKGDSSWVFVRSDNKLIKQGYVPPIHDFELVNLDGEDLTDDILTAERAVLIVMYDLKKSDMAQIDKVRALVREEQWNETPVYVLTGSNDFEIEEMGLSDLPFLTCDPVTLKTIVRANPGVVVLEEGTIVEKYNLKNK